MECPGKVRESWNDVQAIDFVWWSRWESNPRPLECHPISGLDYSLPITGNPKKLRTKGFRQWGDVSTWLHVFSDKKRTVIHSVRLIGSQEVRLNPSNLGLFFPLSVSVSFPGRRQWKNKRSADGAAMKDARIARRTNGRNGKMVVVSVDHALYPG
jgi:hypothetical protein